MKRFLAAILCVAMCLTMCPVAFAVEENEILSYEVSNGEATITGLADPAAFDGELIIPESIGDGIPVTAIGEFAFESLTVHRLSFPATLRVIDECAFYDIAFNCDVVIPEGVTTLGDYAFEACVAESLSLPASLSDIGMTALGFTGLRSISISPCQEGRRAVPLHRRDEERILLQRRAVGVYQ